MTTLSFGDKSKSYPDKWTWVDNDNYIHIDVTWLISDYDGVIGYMVYSFTIQKILLTEDCFDTEDRYILCLLLSA